MNRVRTALALLAASCALTAMTSVVPAQATPPPTVSLSPVHTQISATGSASFGYHAHHLRTGSRVALQVYEDSAWTTLARTGKKHGSAAGTFHIDMPGEPGVFRFRAAVVRTGHVRAVSGTHRIYAYGTVSLHALCVGVLDGDCEPGTTPVGASSSFYYTLLTGINEPADPFAAQIGAATTSCRSLHLRYISDQQGDGNTYLELRQPGHKTQKHTNSSEVVGTFNATLTGGRFGLDVKQDSSGVFMYFNGSGSCYTSTGVR